MTTQNFTPPEYLSDGFDCPHCGIYSLQTWIPEGRNISVTGHLGNKNHIEGSLSILEDFSACQCFRCKKICLWMNEKLIYPDLVSVKPPNQDLPEDIKKLYEEAASILHKSPRAATAVLRVALEKLCQEKGKQNLSLNENIALLIKNKEIPEILEKAMNTIRVFGNNAAHPGKINFDGMDSPDVARKLFKIINIIADRWITDEREVHELYEETVPESEKSAES